MESPTARGLGDLPLELLEAIAKHTDSYAAINALARTCRYFYPLLNQVLYRHNSKEKHPTRSALLWAAKRGRVETTRHALEAFKPLKWGRPLREAAASGHGDVVALLIGAMADMGLNTRDNDGYSAVDMALMEGHSEVLKQLLDAEANPEAKGQKLKRQYSQGRDTPPPLYAAIENGHSEAIQILLATAKVEIDKKRWEGHTPLTYACEQNMPDVVECLLEAGASPNAPGEDDSTPLMLTILESQHVLVELLLKHGADPNRVGRRYPRVTPIFHAIEARLRAIRQRDLYWRQEKSMYLVNMLIDNTNVDLNHVDSRRYTPLLQAMFFDPDGLHKMYLSSNPEYFSPAVAEARVELAKAVLKASRMSSSEILFALTGAVEKNFIETNPVIKIILESGFDIEPYREVLLRAARRHRNMTAAGLLQGVAA